jgi:hypothetical protein
MRGPGRVACHIQCGGVAAVVEGKLLRVAAQGLLAVALLVHARDEVDKVSAARGQGKGAVSEVASRMTRAFSCRTVVCLFVQGR